MASMGLSSRAIIGNFYQRLDASMGSSWMNGIVWENNSTDQQNEEYRFLGQTPKVQKWNGQTKSERLTSKGIIVANERYDWSLNVPIDDLRRDKTSQIIVRAQEGGQQFANFYEEQFTNMIVNGTASTYGNAYDGTTFFSTSHSEGLSGTQKNVLTSSEVDALNVNSASAPTEDEMSKAVLNSMMKFYGLLDDQGQPINGSAKQFTLMVSTNLAGASYAALYNAIVTAASGNTTSNSLYGLRNEGWGINLAINPRLTTTDVFYLFRTDGITKPFIKQNEVPVSMTYLGPESEYAKFNKEVLWSAEWVGGFGYGQWQHALKCTLS